MRLLNIVKYKEETEKSYFIIKKTIKYLDFSIFNIICLFYTILKNITLELNILSKLIKNELKKLFFIICI